MKKEILLLVVSVFAGVAMARAGARINQGVMLVGQDDGNTRVGISTQCISTSWNAVVGLNNRRRLIKLVSVKTNGNTLCLGTDDSGGSCADGQLGYEMGTLDNYSDASEGKLYCRSRSGTQILKGFELYDSRD